ncbi:MAG: hypothetical protein ABEL76_05210 [Bradymonadaceae bacterium]
MLEVYVFSLVLGGIFVALSVLGGVGGETEVEADAEAEVDFEAGAEADADIGAEAGEFDVEAGGVETGGLGDVDLSDVPFEFDLQGAGLDSEVEAETESTGGDYTTSAQRRFNPFVSFKFYTFSLAFFGLTGVLLQGTGLWTSTIGVALVSAVMGLVAGVGVAYGMHIADTSGDRVTERDYLGAAAEVLLPIEGRDAGKVRFQVKGRTVDMRARAFHDGDTFEMNQKCFVMDVDDGEAEVVGVETVEKQLLESD